MTKVIICSLQTASTDPAVNAILYVTMKYQRDSIIPSNRISTNNANNYNVSKIITAIIIVNALNWVKQINLQNLLKMCDQQ